MAQAAPAGHAPVVAMLTLTPTVTVSTPLREVDLTSIAQAASASLVMAAAAAAGLLEAV